MHNNLHISEKIIKKHFTTFVFYLFIIQRCYTNHRSYSYAWSVSKWFCLFFIYVYPHFLRDTEECQGTKYWHVLVVCVSNILHSLIFLWHGFPWEWIYFYTNVLLISWLTKMHSYIEYHISLRFHWKYHSRVYAFFRYKNEIIVRFDN